jgi:cytochrome c biogenesis protein CcdA/glutaredoxin
LINKKFLLPVLLLALMLVLLWPASVLANPNRAGNDATIYFFWGDGCPHCADEEIFLDALVEEYPQVKVLDYEVWYDTANQEILKKAADVMGFEPKGVPVTVIGEKVWIGFREQYKAEMKAAVIDCIANTCESPIENVVLSTEIPSEVQTNSDQVITLPIFGEVDLGEQSLAVSTLIIGFVDGFNPCSLWVISVLLALALTSGSRTKVITVGLTYLLVTTLVYSLFILGVFTLFSYIGYLKWIQVIVALVAIGFGVINMKDYFWYKEGVSFTISDKHKPKLYQNMRDSVVTPRSLFGLISSTAVMAAGVSLIEFSCTAGFPVIWSNIMIANNVSGLYFALLLGLYMLIYLLDEIGVIAVASITMKAARVEEKHGRLLKLISGTIMLALGIVMLIDPTLMNNLSSSLVVFAIALALTALIYFFHQKVLPGMGIYIGSGFKETKKKKRH